MGVEPLVTSEYVSSIDVSTHYSSIYTEEESVDDVLSDSGESISAFSSDRFGESTTGGVESGVVDSVSQGMVVLSYVYY